MPRRNELTAAANAGARLDRLPISSFHRRILWLIGVGMFFDGFDIYVAAAVLGTTLKSGFSTLGQNAQFVSVTFVGMMLGAFLTGFLGDRYGRRFTYQANLAIFGLASIAAAFAPTMTVLILLRLIMGAGLGAENVVGYATMTEFVPPQARGKWVGIVSVFVVAGLPATALLGTLIIPRFGWRVMFVLGGVGAMVVWYLRKKLPESPRWLESIGRNEDADAILRAIELEVSLHHHPVPPPAPLPPAMAARGLGDFVKVDEARRTFVILLRPPRPHKPRIESTVYADIRTDGFLGRYSLGLFGSDQRFKDEAGHAVELEFDKHLNDQGDLADAKKSTVRILNDLYKGTNWKCDVEWVTEP